MMTSSTYWIAFLAFLVTSVCGLKASPNSPCAHRCIDDPDKGNPGNHSDFSTLHDNFECFDNKFSGKNSTAVGRKFQDCQSCIKTSGFEDDKSHERDTNWFMFNNKGMVDWCIFGRFSNEKREDVSKTYPYQQCNTACQAIYSPIDYRIKDDTVSYQFCDHDGNFTSDADPCISCLYGAGNLTILGNVLTTVQELCRQKPGRAFTFDANIYTASRIELSSATTASSSSSATAPPSDTTGSQPPSNPDSGLSNGAIAGVVLGALLGLVAILGAILFFLRRVKNRRAIMPTPKELHGYGTNPADYHYDPVTQGPKEHYAHQPGNFPVAESMPVELGTQNEVQELSTKTTPPATRH